MTFDFCPKCGHAGTVKRQNVTEFACTNCGERFWNNPKAATAVVFLRGQEALFAKRGRDPDKGKYEFPGGFVDYGEDVYACCAREIREETGLDIAPEAFQLLTAYTSEYQDSVSTVDLVFVVTEWTGEPVAADDVAALEWKPLSFMDDPEFIRPYHDLAEKLRAFQQT